MKRKFTKKRLSLVFPVGFATSLAGRSGALYSPSHAFTGKTKTIGESSFAEKRFNPHTSESSPNVVSIVLDDAGFGAVSSLEGHIETPNLVSLVGKAKLRYDVNYIPTVKNAKENAGTEFLWVKIVKVGDWSLTKEEFRLSPFAEGFDIGRDALSQVSNLYQSPFNFGGKLNKVIIEYR